MRDPAPIITEAHDRVRDLYGSAIGQSKHDVVTPALVIDRDDLLANLTYMESRLPSLHARLRGHVKNHKSPHVARLQLEHGAFGICAATVWEAIVMVRAGADDVLIANQLVDPHKQRAAALLAREANVLVNVDDVGDAEALSSVAREAGTTLGILVEVDTGMHRAGADTPEEALRVARRVQELPALRMDGLSGYEGHCSMEMDHDERHRKQARAMDYFVEVADLLEANGIPCPILSAAGTATAFWTGQNPRITELQLGSYAAMDDYHYLMEPRFRKATSAVVTVISRRRDRVVLNLGKKTFGAADVGSLPAYPRIVGHEGLTPYRFDEEHATYEADDSCSLKVGDVVDFHLGYTPFAVNYFDAYHVVEGDTVVDIWPIMPRGPLHGGLLSMLEAGALTDAAMTDRDGFAVPEGVNQREFVVATYAYRTPPGVDIHGAVRALAEMQSTGTWVALERETAALRERHAARVIATWEVPDNEVVDPTPGHRDWVVQLAFPLHNLGAQIPLLLATVYGECASAGEIRLLDLDLPAAFTGAFKGPKFGLDGIRTLVGAAGRPLLIVMMKPAIGMTPRESAEVFRQVALGGADGVKDDELLVSHPWSHFLDRIREHERAAHEAFEETGHRTLYFVNITDRPDRLVENAHRAIEAGASALMVDYLTVGISAISMLADDPAIAVPILGHLAFSGALYAAPRTGVSSHLVLGKLPRLAGADTVVYPSPYGSLQFTRSKQIRLARAMTGPFNGIRPTLPVPGGGLHAGMTRRLFDDLGIDFAVGAGGAVHGHPMGATAGARAIRQAIAAVVRGEPLDQAREHDPELAAALDHWPGDGGPADPGEPESTTVPRNDVHEERR